MNPENGFRWSKSPDRVVAFLQHYNSVLWHRLADQIYQETLLSKTHSSLLDSFSAGESNQSRIAFSLGFTWKQIENTCTERERDRRSTVKEEL